MGIRVFSILMATDPTERIELPMAQRERYGHSYVSRLMVQHVKSNLR